MKAITPFVFNDFEQAVEDAGFQCFASLAFT